MAIALANRREASLQVAQRSLRVFHFQPVSLPEWSQDDQIRNPSPDAFGLQPHGFAAQTKAAIGDGIDMHIRLQHSGQSPDQGGLDLMLAALWFLLCPGFLHSRRMIQSGVA